MTAAEAYCFPVIIIIIIIIIMNNNAGRLSSI